MAFVGTGVFSDVFCDIVSAYGHGPMGAIREGSLIGHFDVHRMLCSCEKVSTQSPKHASAS